MSLVFLRHGLDYNQQLLFTIQEIINFWREQDSDFPANKKVLLKPNLLSPHPPESAVTTHPLLVQYLATELRKFDNQLIIADSPAGTHNKNIQKLWETTGMLRAAENAGAMLVNINKRGLTERKGLNHNFFVTDLLNEVDYIVNLPKMKTHGLTLLTGAVKNVFGLIPGIQKGEYHVRYPKPADFAENLVEIYSAIKPHFTIMDAILIMEGNGPSSGGSARYAGFLLAGKDGVAIDSIAAKWAGIPPLSVNTNRIALEKELGEAVINNIAIRGDSIQSHEIELPSSHAFSHLPNFVYGILQKLIWTRPRADESRCTRCGICIKNCPVDAMAPDDSGVPVIDDDICIKCFCCSEVCPDDAIYQETSRLVKWLS